MYLRRHQVRAEDTTPQAEVASDNTQVPSDTQNSIDGVGSNYFDIIIEYQFNHFFMWTFRSQGQTYLKVKMNS